MVTQAYIHGCLNYIWWFHFKCLQHQITWRASMWLCASAAQTGCVSTCVCRLCANEWQRERERKGERETHRENVKQRYFMDDNDEWATSFISVLISLNPFSLLKSDLIITSVDCASQKKSKMMQSTRKDCPWCYWICPLFQSLFSILNFDTF